MPSAVKRSGKDCTAARGEESDSAVPIGTTGDRCGYPGKSLGDLTRARASVLLGGTGRLSMAWVIPLQVQCQPTPPRQSPMAGLVSSGDLKLEAEVLADGVCWAAANAGKSAPSFALSSAAKPKVADYRSLYQWLQTGVVDV